MKRTSTAASLICAVLLTGQVEGDQIEQLCCFSPDTVIQQELDRFGKMNFELSVKPTGHGEKVTVQVVYQKGPVTRDGVDRRTCLVAIIPTNYAGSEWARKLLAPAKKPSLRRR